MMDKEYEPEIMPTDEIADDDPDYADDAPDPEVDIDDEPDETPPPDEGDVADLTLEEVERDE
jgi:hypothetical protein